MQFSFVIPTYNRKQNVDLLLYALRLQTDQDFEVIVSDDGSTDGTKEMLEQHKKYLRLKYCRQDHDGYRVSMVRNLGTHTADPASTHIWFLDSDNLLNRDAVAYARDLCTREPRAIICGRYDWLPPMIITPKDIADAWPLIAAGKLPRVTVNYPSESEVRPDHRNYFRRADVDETPHSSRGTLSGNLIVPRIWLKRGFDETIHGQGQDGEFGHHIQVAGAKCIFCGKIVAYHMAHFNDVAWKISSVQRTIRYIRNKYRLKGYTDSEEPTPW